MRIFASLNCAVFIEQVFIEQPLGGYQYESIRSFQYTIPEMYDQFKNSEFGYRQKIAHNDRDLSLRRFRELICPCMTQAKQRDTADEIVAELKHCFLTWDICMRKKDSNVRVSIARCQLTDCQKHKKGSNSANMYALASKSPSHFMNYLLCPKVQGDELAVKIATSPSTFLTELNVKKASNIAAAIAAKEQKDLDFWASGARKGIHMKT